MQERCWEEVNRVIGADRAPKLSDRSNTPYVDATIQVHKTMLLINASIEKGLLCRSSCATARTWL